MEEPTQTIAGWGFTANFHPLKGTNEMKSQRKTQGEVSTSLV